MHPLSACSQGAVCGQGQSAPGPDDERGAFLYQPDTVLDLQLFLDATALAELPDGPGEQADDVHATLSFEDQQWSAGLRLKGASSFRQISKKAAFKIDFGEWDPDGSFYGVRRLTLNNMVQDESMLSENLAYWLHAAIGGVAPSQGYACVRLNGDSYGLYSVVETMDEQFVERQFEDPSGNLYEGGKGADIRMGRAELFDIEEQGVPKGRGDLEALIDAMETYTPETWLEALDRHFVLSELLGMWAVELFVGNIDSYITRSNNFLLYHQPSTTTWTMIPWGEDQAFTEALDPLDPYDPDVPAKHGQLYEGCLASTACVDALSWRIEELVEHVESESLVEHAVAQRDLISDLSRSDPLSGAGRWETRGAQNDVLRFLERRSVQILEQLEEPR